MTPPDRDNLELLEAARGGDLLALQKLLARHHGRLVAALRSKIPAAHSAAIEPEDVCQETYVAVGTELAKFEPRGPDSFFAWLMAIANRRLIDMVRALKAEKRGGDRVRIDARTTDSDSTAFLLEQLATDSHTPSRSFARQEVVNAVQAALTLLPVDQGNAVRLRYVEGLSLQETAARMRRSVGAVAMLCQRGVSRLAEPLAHLIADSQPPGGTET